MLLRKEFVAGTLNAVDTMAIGAGRHIWVTRRQRRAMDTLLICIEDRAVTLGTGLRDSRPRFCQELPRALIRDAHLCVRVMTIRTNGSVGIPSRQLVLVNTVQRAFELVGVTLLACAVQFQ